MGHPIHKHMSSGQRYDDKQAYNKDLPASERLHYLENEENDKGMSRHSSPANNVSYGDKSGVTGYIGEQRADLMKYNPVDDRAGMSRYGSDHGDSPAELTAGGKKKIMASDANPAFKKAIASSPIDNITYGDKSGPTGYIGQEKKDLMKYNPIDDKAGMSRYKRDY